MKLIFVAGSWGSGTTAVVGALDALGVPTFGPYFNSNDPKTQNTFELQSFREVVFRYVEESAVRLKPNYHSDFVPALEKFKQEMEQADWPENTEGGERVFALKMPVASICIPEICKVFETKIIMVHRPFKEIEASRARRGWNQLFGAAGANVIYNQMFATFFQEKLSFLGVSYNDFVTDTESVMETIIAYCELDDLRVNIENAMSFVRKP